MSSGPSVVYMGTPHFAVEPLRALVNASYTVKAVVTVPDKPAGRGLKLTASPVKQFAAEHGLPVLQPDKLRDETFLTELLRLAPDVIVVVAFRMLPEQVWKMARLGTFNLHASLLPQYRGAAPINWAIMNGESHTGLTTFLIDHQIDTGKILFQETTPILPHETAGQLHDRLMAMGGPLVLRTIDALAQGTVKPIPQVSLIGAEIEIKPAPKLFKANCKIDWVRPAPEVYNQIRGLSPYPGAWCNLTLPDGTLTTAKVLSASLSDRNPSDTRNTQLMVPCGKDAIFIDQIQPAGKKPMSAGEFMRGLRGEGRLAFS